MKILITTPLYPPEIGGPAYYASELEKEFRKKGNRVRTLNFPKNIPSGLRHSLLLLRIGLAAISSRVIFSLDYFSVGFPAALVSKFFAKKFFVRVAGDFLWEHYVNRTRKKITIKEFYQNIPELSIKEKFIFWASKFTFRQAYRVIFSTTWQRDIFLTSYNIKLHRTVVVENHFPLKNHLVVQVPSKEFVWAGRMVALKNLDTLVKAFIKFASESEEAWGLRIIGNGPNKREIISQIKKNKLEDLVVIEDSVDKDKLMEIIGGAWATIIPSLSEVSSNFLIESLFLNIPFIITKENGYAEKFKELGIFVNPKSKEEIYEAIKEMSKVSTRSDYQEKIKNTNFVEQSWQDMAGEYLNIFKI